MEVIHRRCAGLDVHKQMVVACVRIASDAASLQQVRTFDTKRASARSFMARSASTYMCVVDGL